MTVATVRLPRSASTIKLAYTGSRTGRRVDRVSVRWSIDQLHLER
jgi:hypothetical protein